MAYVKSEFFILIIVFLYTSVFILRLNPLDIRYKNNMSTFKLIDHTNISMSAIILKIPIFPNHTAYILLGMFYKTLYIY